MINRRSQKVVRGEAAAWVMRLRDAHTAADREAFEHWIARDPSHQGAFDRAAASYDAAGVLRTSSFGRERDLNSVFPRRKAALARSFAIASIAGLLLLGAYELSDGFAPLRPVAIETVMLSTGGEARNVTLPDGSKLSISPNSQVLVDLSRTLRRAEIRKGRVRITVAKEKRPFRIIAGAHSAEAGAGIFDAQIVGGQGAVTVADENGHSSTPVTDRSISEARGFDAPVALQTAEFSATPLDEALERINELSSGPRLELDPDLANLRITGVVRHGDSLAIGRSLAVAFDLKLVVTPAGTLRLTR